MSYLANNSSTFIPEEITIKIPKNFNTKYIEDTFEKYYYCSFILNKNSGDVIYKTGERYSSRFKCDYLIIDTFKVNGNLFYFSLYRTYFSDGWSYNDIGGNKNSKIIIIDKEGKFPLYMKQMFKFYDYKYPKVPRGENYWNNFNCRHIETVDCGNQHTLEDWKEYNNSLPYPITVDKFINVKE